LVTSVLPLSLCFVCRMFGRVFRGSPDKAEGMHCQAGFALSPILDVGV
jgi:hypothetical protein